MMTTTAGASASASACASIRYVFKYGFVVADDVVRKALTSEHVASSLAGSWIIRLKKPVPCVFVSMGFSGVMLPNTGLCVMSSGYNGVTKDEHMALHRLMVLFDPDFQLRLRSQWILVDLVETQGVVVRRPTKDEVVSLKKTLNDLKAHDRAGYKTVARVDRRHTTSEADVADGHEDDSDQDPMHVMLDDMAERERRSEKARLARLGNFPDTAIGGQVARLMRRASASRKRALEAQAAETCPDSSGASLLPESTAKSKKKRKTTEKKEKKTIDAVYDDEDLFGEAETESDLSSRIVKQRRSAASTTDPPPGHQGSRPDTLPAAPVSSPLEQTIAEPPSSGDEDEPDADAEEVDYGEEDV